MINYKSKILDPLTFIFLLFFAVLLTVDTHYSVSVIDGIKLWIACVLPALFPYLFITSLFSSLKSTEKFCRILSPVFRKLFRTSGTISYAYLMSVISGHPVGSIVVSDLKKANAIGDKDAIIGSCLCSSSSPVFLIASVGNLMMKSALFGVMLFVCNTICSILVGIVFGLKHGEKHAIDKKISFVKSNSNPLYDGVYTAVNSVLMVGGIITIFYLLTEALFSLQLLLPVSKLFSLIFNSEVIGKALSFGIFENTKGLQILSTFGVKLLTLPLSAVMTGFGGISIICQSTAILKQAKIKTAPFILSKLLSAVLNFVLGLIISLIFVNKF